MARPPKANAIERLQKAIDAIPELKQQRYDSPKFTKWKRDTQVALRNIFGDTSSQLNEFNGIVFSPVVASSPPLRIGADKSAQFQEAYRRGLDTATATLESMIEEIEEYGETDNQTTMPSEIHNTNEVFIIHGRDDGTKQAVARFLQTLGLKPVILHEQANLGRTIIEKFEDHAQVGFAVVLLTPDDVGSLNEEEPHLKPRARQNVIFEFGYFIGKLGRERVCALVVGDVEKPSDYDGVLYISFNDSSNWKMKLIGELKAAGINVDANRAFQT